jgi:hypothetical protein
MYNKERTLEVFGYDLEGSKRRTAAELTLMGKTRPRDMLVIDNCPKCDVERTIKLVQSRKNKLCSKCFHNSPEMLEAKRNQTKVKSEEHKQNMRANHWSTKGIESPFKGQHHTQETKDLLTAKTKKYYADRTYEEYGERYKKASCTLRDIPLEDFDGFSAPEGTRIRQSAEGKAWTYDILSKANFTCVKCQIRGGQLHAHHLNGFNSYPEQRFDLDNGACLCHDCHEDFHEVYGKGGNTKEQFDAWLKKV